MTVPDDGSVPAGPDRHLGDLAPPSGAVAGLLAQGDAFAFPGSSPLTLGHDPALPGQPPVLVRTADLDDADGFYRAALDEAGPHPAIVVRLAAVASLTGRHRDAARMLDEALGPATGAWRPLLAVHAARAEVLAGGYLVARDRTVETVAGWVGEQQDRRVGEVYLGLVRAFVAWEWAQARLDPCRVLLDLARRLADRLDLPAGQIAVAADLATLFSGVRAVGAFLAVIDGSWEGWRRALEHGGAPADETWQVLGALGAAILQSAVSGLHPSTMEMLAPQIRALANVRSEGTVPSAAERAGRDLLARVQQVIAMSVPLMTGRRNEQLGRDGFAARLYDEALARALEIVDDPEPALLVLAVARRHVELAARLRALPPTVAAGDVAARYWLVAGLPEEAARALELAGTEHVVGSVPWWQPFALRSTIARRRGHDALARHLADQAQQRVEQWLDQLPHDVWRVSVLDDADVRWTFHAAVLAAADAPATLVAADRSRAHALGRLVAERLDGGPPAPEVRRVRAAAATWNGAFDRLGLAYRSTGVEDALSALATAEVELDSALTASPARDLRPLPPLDPGDVAAALDAETVLLHVTATDEGLVLVIMTRDGEVVVRKPIDRRRLSGVAARVRQDWHDGWPADAGDLAVLAESLLDPVRSRLAHLRRLLVIPDGPLAVLPFAALELDGTTLVTEWSVSQLPAAALVPRLAGRSTLAPTGGALVAGDPPTALAPLWAARVEALQVARMMTTTALLGEAVTEEAVRERMPVADRLVHLATHGILDEDAPDLSHLRLAHDESFTVADVLGIGLDTDLVVLSACDSGRGEITQGGDVVGLARGMIAAGARHTVASTWPVPDRTSCLLIVEFVRLLTAGGTVGDSLAGAQRAVRGWSFDERTERYLALAAEVGEPADPPSGSDRDRLRGAGPLLDLSGPGPTHPRWWGGFVHLGV